MFRSSLSSDNKYNVEYELMKLALKVVKNTKRDINNRHNCQDFGINGSSCQNTLRILGYVPVSSSSSRAIPDIIIDVLNRFGNLQPSRLMLNLRLLSELSESDLYTTYEELTSKISSVFGLVGAGVVLESIKQELQQYLLSKSVTNDMANAYLIRLAAKSSLRDIISSVSTRDYDIVPEYQNNSQDVVGTKSLQIKARATISEILEKIQILDTFENISQLPGGEHMLLLYETEENKDNILSSLLSHPNKSNESSSMLSASWLVDKGFVDEIISLESSLLEDDSDATNIMLPAKTTSIVCAHNISKMTREELRQVIQSHKYVILDDPLVLFKK